jgi:hypothetical protein
MAVRTIVVVFVTWTCSIAPALADDASMSSGGSIVDESAALFDDGKLLATGGVSNLEGAGGGGLATWALISGYGTRDGAGLNAHATYIALPDYSLWTEGATIGLFDRVELSYAHLTFDTQNVGAALGLGKGFEFHQDVVGAKVKLIGDAVYDQDSLLPQIAVGAQYKSTDHVDVLHAVGAKSGEGTDFYVTATKLFLAQSLLVDATVRETRANQFGILGFGGDKDANYSTQFEGSAAYLFSRNIAAGAEIRTRPDNLGIAKEDAAWDIFIAYFIDKHVSVTAAYLDLGNIVIKDHQQGLYLSLQVGL